MSKKDFTKLSKNWFNKQTPVYYEKNDFKILYCKKSTSCIYFTVRQKGNKTEL